MNSWLPFAGGLLLAAGLAWPCQAQQDPTGKANPKDCYRTFAGDSAELYYDDHYLLTPSACATVRRNTHLDATGMFSGLVCDYRLSDHQLLYRLHYRGGKQHGLYEAYHSNGKISARGQFQNGFPTGIWQFWYPNGQAQQTLMWPETPEQPFRIIAYWDSAGAQLCKDGNGTWHGLHPSGHIRFGGPVVEGLAQGTWASTAVRTGKPFSEERYEQGRFVEGFDLMNRRYRYTNPPGLLPQVELPTQAAESFLLNRTCEQVAARAELAKAVVKAPYTAGGLATYNSRLLQLLQKYARESGFTGMRGSITLLINVGKDGQLSLDESNRNPDYARAIMRMLNQLPHWSPATANGQAVPGQLALEMEIGSATVSSRLWPKVKYPLPPLTH